MGFGRLDVEHQYKWTNPTTHSVPEVVAGRPHANPLQSGQTTQLPHAWQ